MSSSLCLVGGECGCTSLRKDLWRLRLNFLVMLAILFLSVLTNVTTYPTLHQYVTNSREVDYVANQTYENYPGLGESELFYSLMLSFYWLGSSLASLLTGLLLLFVPSVVGLLLGTAASTLSSILYSLAYRGWMLAISRTLLGMGFALVKVSILTYIGIKEADYIKAYVLYKGDTEDRDGCQQRCWKKTRGKDLKIKATALSMVSMAMYLPYFFGPGISSVIAQIPSINLFRGIGYFNTSCCFFSVILVLALFHGEYKVVQLLANTNEGYDIHKAMRSGILDHLPSPLVYWFVHCQYSVQSYPVRQLWTDSQRDKLLFCALDVHARTWILCDIRLIIFKVFRPHLVLLCALLLLIVGSALISDWQTLGEDPCRRFSPHYHEVSPPPHNSAQSQRELTVSTNLHHLDLCVLEAEATDEANWTQQARELCQATRGCLWNQFSVLTGAFCVNCPAICRSAHQSLSIVQFTVGALMFIFALPIQEACGWILLSDNLRENEQGPVIGVVYAVTGIMGIANPIWLDAVYVKSHRRTLVPMAVYLILCSIVLTGLLVLFQVLDPRHGKPLGDHRDDSRASEDERQTLVEN